MMSGISLSWENKNQMLIASGSASYKWVGVEGQELVKPLKLSGLGNFVPDSGNNILAIGDGLDAIEALAAETDALSEKIRLVYIDPPFNTSADVKCYEDTMERSMWLSMLRDRLAVLKPHLSDDASIWVHLDDSEVHRARLVMDEVFGERAFVSTVIWQKRTTRESRSAFSNNHDTILVYAPSGPRKWKTSRNLLNKDTALLENRDNDPRGPWADAPFTAPGFRAAQQYSIETPSGNVLKPPRGRSWYATESTYKDLLAEDRIWFPKNGGGSPRLKLFSHQLRGLVPFTIWGTSETGTNDEAKRHLLSLFSDKEVFDTPKPEELLERIIHISTRPGELVVDLFGGSGTTAAVAHKMRRKWVTVERNIETVIEFTLPRLQAVVEGTDLGGITGAANWKGGGDFAVVSIAPRLGRAVSKKRLSLVEERLSVFEDRQTGAAVG
ncbi:site-specific DNA-methyltransferase [Aliiroseovarius sp. KMU-50]|uniref:site-specific DNA-methyltransferase (adenine-specific) n=1 Tax=Aliiroseovarius salicola TaxID=3009082 RepID=A0ABT4W3M2_9RHOB|nr:site-specific DNA-methyltransferase [Aliiroseovarius sp. KMU-50]MDA5095014.1 site-specific DNA-methyltransferase [Aliiroseovarius sp. KMU-50]